MAWKYELPAFYATKILNFETSNSHCHELFGFTWRLRQGAPWLANLTIVTTYRLSGYKRSICTMSSRRSEQQGRTVILAIEWTTISRTKSQSHGGLGSPTRHKPGDRFSGKAICTIIQQSGTRCGLGLNLN